MRVVFIRRRGGPSTHRLRQQAGYDELAQDDTISYDLYEVLYMQYAAVVEW